MSNPPPRVRLRGEKAIAAELERLWGFEVCLRSITRWRGLKKDPLPHERIALGEGARPIIACDPEKLRAWAERRLRAQAA